jgi:hypothetical protein
VVSRVVVKEAEQVTARHGVDDLVNPRQSEGVLGAVFVEIDIVNSYPPLVRVLLMDKDRVGKPLRMEDFFDEAGRK